MDLLSCPSWRDTSLSPMQENLFYLMLCGPAEPNSRFWKVSMQSKIPSLQCDNIPIRFHVLSLFPTSFLIPPKHTPPPTQTYLVWFSFIQSQEGRFCFLGWFWLSVCSIPGGINGCYIRVSRGHTCFRDPRLIIARQVSELENFPEPQCVGGCGQSLRGGSIFQTCTQFP